MADSENNVNVTKESSVIASTSSSVMRCVPSLRRIATVESLREHLQWAIELEHFTLPPYLCALYSLDPDRNPDATKAILLIRYLLQVCGN